MGLIFLPSLLTDLRAKAKASVQEAMRDLENISNDIHEQRQRRGSRDERA